MKKLDIGSRLRALREQKHLTQEDVGNRIGVTKATINRYETGEIDIKRTVAIKLARVLSTTPQYIMGWSTSASPTNRKKITIDKNIKKYFLLNDVGRSKVSAYINDLLCNPRYVITDETSGEMVAYDLDDMPEDEWQPKDAETTAIDC